MLMLKMTLIRTPRLKMDRRKKSESEMEKSVRGGLQEKEKKTRMGRTELNKPIWWFWLEVFFSSLIFIGF